MIYFLDEQLNVVNKINVNQYGKKYSNLNELEYVNGLIYSNIWMSNSILIINPIDGNVIR
jgi:glutamine cyclotransferase